MEKLRLFVLKGVANELQKPAKDEESGGEHPERMIENGGHGKRPATPRSAECQSYGRTG